VRAYRVEAQADVASSIVDRKPLALPDKPSIAPNPAYGEISFGSFRLRPSQQLLLDDDKPTPLEGAHSTF
jgi:hypothetical protein